MSDSEYKKEVIMSGSDAGAPSYGGESDMRSNGVFARVVDSFKRDPHQHATPKGVVGADGKVFDVETAAAATAESPLARKLKGRHLQMIAIGGSIGNVPNHFLDRQFLMEMCTNKIFRYWSFCWIRKRTRAWRSCIPPHRFLPHRCHVVLYRPRAG